MKPDFENLIVHTPFNEVEFAPSGNTYLRITEGPFKDVVFYFGSVSFEEGESLKMNFGYEVVANEPSDETKRKELETLIGDYMVYILTRSLDNVSSDPNGYQLRNSGS